MMMCKKCSMAAGAMFLVLGVAYLLQDLGMWNFWGINWWTALFLLMGIGHMCASKCPDCGVMKR